jgi:PAS domain S-box-containing protein
MIKYNRNISLVLCAILIANTSLSLIPYINAPLVILVSLLIMTRKQKINAKAAASMQDLFAENSKYRLDLLKSETELSTFFKLTPNILGIATTGQFTRVSDNFKNLLGYENDELLNQPFLSFIHPDDVKKTEDLVANALDGDNIIVDFENRYRKKDGTYINVNWQAILYNDIFYVAGKDVTKEKELITEIKTNERKFRKFFETSPAPMCIFDRGDLVFTDVNNSFCEEMEYTKEELVNRSFKEFIHPDDYTTSVDANTTAVADNTHPVNYNYKNRYITKSGKVKTINWNSSGGGDRFVFCTAEFIKPKSKKNNETLKDIQSVNK